MPSGCEIYKYSEKYHFKGKESTQVDMTPQGINAYVNFSLPEINKRLSLVPLWDKYKLEFIESHEKIKRIQKSIP